MSLVLLIYVLEQLDDDGGSPRVRGVADDALVEFGVSSVLFLVRHDESLIDGVGDSVDIVRVDEESRREGSC